MEQILTTHAGSLIRPPELAPFLAAIQAGQPYDTEAYAACLQQAVTDVVRRQAGAGVNVVSDGEMSKATWITYLYDRVGGLESRVVPLEGGTFLPPSRDRQAFPEFYAEHDAREGPAPADDGDAATWTVWSCTGPITYDPTALQRDIADFRAALDGVEVAGAFLPVVAPASAYWLGNEYYPSEEAFVFALADALHEEYRGIVDAGLLLQVDDAVLVHECDTMLSQGRSIQDYRRWAELRVEALNHALRGLPSDRVRYHICWGSWHGPHAYDPPLADIVDLVLKVRAGAYLFENANPRHEHEWRVWEDVRLPEGTRLVPGVVTHHTNIVEHPELVADRITRLAKVVGRENVMAGTDCGFAQGSFVRRVHPTIQWAKLEALAEGARIATKRLWGANTTA